MINPFNNKSILFNLEKKPNTKNYNMNSKLKSEFTNMWGDLIKSPGNIEALVQLGNNNGKLFNNGTKKGGISFTSGRNIDTKVVVSLELKSRL
jgi:hypothetical protein